MRNLKWKQSALAVGLMAAGVVWADYTILDMGAIGGTYSAPVEINNNSEAVGASRTTTNLQHAFFFGSSVIADVHGYLGTNPAWRSYATSINDNGQIVGAFGPVGGASHAFLIDLNLSTGTDLGTLGGTISQASGINNNGDIVGGSTLSGDATWHTFVYSGGVMNDIGGLPGYAISQGKSINNNGDVVGNSWGATCAAFLYSNGVMTNIGGLGGTCDWVQNINDYGQIVGSSYLPGDTIERAFLYSNGAMTDIGVLIPGAVKSTATGINNNGDIVGQYYTGPGLSGLSPFLYSGGVMQNLNALLPPNSGWTLLYARDINDYGQIVGVGTINGENHGFLMTPGC